MDTERNSKVKRRSSRTFSALIVSTLMLSAAIMLSTMTNDSLAQSSSTNTTASSSSSSSSGEGQGTKAAGLSLNCQAIASKIGGISIPNPNKICDVLIPRQAPTIVGPGNMNMNKFSTINSIVEVGAISDLMVKSNASNGGDGGSGSSSGGGAASSATSNASSQQVFAMGEFSLLDPQLVTMVKSTGGYNWTIAAIHNHMVLEKPKMMFVHWSAQGDLNTITDQIKNALLILSKVPSSSGGSSGG